MRRGRDWPHSEEARALRKKYRGKIAHWIYQQAKKEWLKNGSE